MNRGKPIGIPALMSLYRPMAAANAQLRQLKASVDYGEVMPNIPQMGRFFSALGNCPADRYRGASFAQG